ncbi:MAG: tRNA (adenosine(37)-N6)-threonylcarbamoyltransferase complex transferase subunit TsaD [Candidatus Marinamargulisbacteria bacterium]
MILAIETSCDETSVAVVYQGKILANALYSQIRHHHQYGGVVPELASRLHADTIDIILKRALGQAKVSLSDITSVAVTVGPGLEGALLVGVTAAHTLSQLLGVPWIPVNHLHGHIFAAMDAHDMQFPLLACLASGGHTMLVFMKDPTSFEVICNTMDDACGEAFDKVARMLDLGYPGGPKVEALATSGAPIVPLPHPVKNKSNAFSFSGLKTATLTAIQSDKGYTSADIAASFQARVADILAHKIQLAMGDYPVKQLILCGGVFANQAIRSHITQAVSVASTVVPALNLCTDNAGMIGLAAQAMMDHGPIPVTPVACCPQMGVQYAWEQCK